MKESTNLNALQKVSEIEINGITYVKTTPSNIDVRFLEEFIKISFKQSKLSRRKREYVSAKFMSYYSLKAGMPN